MHRFDTVQADVWRGGNDAARTKVQIKSGNSSAPKAAELVDKDLLEDHRVEALNTIARYQEATKSLKYNFVKIKEFVEGDLILIQTPRTQAKAKLGPKWEGPYIVSKKTLPYAYRLTSQTSVQLEHN